MATLRQGAEIPLADNATPGTVSNEWSRLEIARSEVTVTLITSFQFVSGGIRDRNSDARAGKKLACLPATVPQSG